MEVAVERTMVDDATCKKVASLIAYGLSDRQVADALILTDEQVAISKTSQVYLEALAENTLARANRAIDLEEGWDLVEERALSAVLETLQFNRDPRYALLAARTANQAKRRAAPEANRTIDASKTNNVIVLQLSRTYVDKRQVNVGHATLAIEAQPAEFPKKINDVISPAKVTELLAGPKEKATKLQQSLDAMCEELGVDPSLLEEAG